MEIIGDLAFLSYVLPDQLLRTGTLALFDAGNETFFYPSVYVLEMRSSTSSLIAGAIQVVPMMCTERANVLPTDTAGNMTAIRAKAQAFNTMQPVVARTIGHIMIWAVVALANEHARLKSAEFETPAQQNVMRKCKSAAQDGMVFAGLIRYKLPGRVWETVAQAGQELGN